MSRKRKSPYQAAKRQKELERKKKIELKKQNKLKGKENNQDAKPDDSLEEQ